MTADSPVVRRAPWVSRLRIRGVTEAYSSNYVLLLAITLLLVVIGLVMVLSSSAIDSYSESDNFFSTFFKQGFFAIAGIPLMLMVSRMPVSLIRRWAGVFFLAALALQALVFTPLGYGSGGNRNWIRVGSLSVQPSEVLKVALLLWLAVVLARRPAQLNQLKAIAFPGLIGVALAVGLVLLGHDLGTAMVMLLAVFGSLYFARVPLRYFVIAGAAAVGGVIVLAVTSPNRMNRIDQFLSPDCTDYLGSCWQSVHGTWALANGGVFGVGLGNSVAKWSWLPAAENDFIFAIIGEELGLVGAVVVFALFLGLAVVFCRIILSAPDSFSRVFVGGVMVWIVGQAFVNMGVVVGVLPVLGVPLPLISSGGSALISALVAIGLVLAVSRENPTPLVVGTPKEGV